MLDEHLITQTSPLAQTLEQYISIVKNSDFSSGVKDRLLETISYS